MPTILDTTRYCPNPWGLHTGTIRYLARWMFAGLCEDCYLHAVHNKQLGANPSQWKFTCSTGDYSAILAIDFVNKDQLREYRNVENALEYESSYDFIIAGYNDREIALPSKPKGDPEKARPVFILHNTTGDGSTGTISFGDNMGYWYPLPVDKHLFNTAVDYIESAEEKHKQIIICKLKPELTTVQIAEIVEVSRPTVYKQWGKFKGYILSEISERFETPATHWKQVKWNLRKKYVLVMGD